MENPSYHLEQENKALRQKITEARKALGEPQTSEEQVANLKLAMARQTLYTINNLLAKVINEWGITHEISEMTRLVAATLQETK
jgi:hypothetical protein